MGAGAASLAINSDLLSSSSVDEARDSISLYTASPTAAPLYLTDLRLGSYDDSFQKYQTTGTVHGDGLGYVVAHTSRDASSELNGDEYRDESGLSYDHIGRQQTIGDLVRLTDAFGATSLSLTYAESTMNAQQIPIYFSGALPAGDGPGTHHNEEASNPLLFISTPLRGGQLTLSAARWSLSTISDMSSRLVALSPAPQVETDRTAGTDVTVSFSAVPSRNRALNASVTQTTTSTSSSSIGTLNGTPYGGPFIQSTRTTEASIAEDWHGSARIPFTITMKDRVSDQLGGSAELGISGQYIVSPTTRLRYSGTFGTKLVDLASAQASDILLDPATAQFDCANGAAVLAGPGATGTKTHGTSHDLEFSTSGQRSSFSVSAYQHNYANASIGSVPFVATSLPTAYFPAGYLSAVQHEYNVAGGCSGTLPLNQIFLDEAFTGANLVYRGANASAHIALSRAWTADVSLGVERARITGGDPRLVATPFFPGSFIPGVPDYKANIVIGWQQPQGRVSAVVSATLTGPHNPRQLPAYTMVNAAIQRTISPSSSVALLVSNLFNTLTDPFISTRFAVPLTDSNGRVIPTFAAPLLPRRIEAKYTVRFGKDELLH
jgi:hypothetical protein